jgi:CHAT domain-containing protein
MRDAINFESFKQTLTKCPKMIHISCHGDFDPIMNEFYLQFEELGTGVVDKFNQSRLNDLMGGSENDPNNQIQIAFISACYSE